jgi:hypothetical protein
MQSVLEKLELIVKERKNLSNKLYSSLLIKKISNSDFDFFLTMINMLKEEENNQRRLDWKSGYIYALMDCSETFGNPRNESIPNEEEMQEIDEISAKFIKNNLK